jgi:uroporphyrinogen decarboxylase
LKQLAGNLLLVGRIDETRELFMITSRERVKKAIAHQEPDRMPVDFLATPEVWEAMIDRLESELEHVEKSDFFDSRWESLLRYLEVDCRVLSYDQFISVPDSMLKSGEVDWWKSMSRSTPNRMWRLVTPDGIWRSIWGHTMQISEYSLGAYEEIVDPPFQDAANIEDLKKHQWPDPSWWDFSSLPDALAQLDQNEELHIRFRIGSVFELAWQLRGMEQFLQDMILQPEMPAYIMDKLTEVYVENTRRVMEQAGDRIDMFYVYDDVAAQNNLLISKKMWFEQIRPRHEKIFSVVREYKKPMMYHTDGAVAALIPELIDLGVDVLNPIQVDAPGMDPRELKAEYGERLSFHGGIDIIKTLPKGTCEEVREEVVERRQILGEQGGYIMASSHHIQPGTPIDNILAMYDINIR